MLPVLAAVLHLALSQGETDTTVAVRQGQRLDFSNFGGSVVVKTWRQNAIRVRANHSSRARIQVSTDGPRVSIEARGRHGRALVDYDILAPTWMAVSVQGSPESEVTIEGTEAEVSVETVEGAIRVVGGRGNISLHSVEGDVTLEGAQGHIEVNTVDGSIRLKNCTGDIRAETVDGDVMLEEIESADVSVGSVDGGISYAGTLKDGGRYRFQTHDGDLDIAVPERTNATVSVATFDGILDASFPLPLKGKTKHRSSFTLGSGSARIELESFDGTIRLRRPNEMTQRKEE